MCGRYQRRSDKQRIAEAFALDNVDGLALDVELDLAPNYNVAPGTMQPVVIWRHWRSGDKKRETDTFAIITVEPNELVKKTTHHDRMPLIIRKQDWQRMA